LRSPRSSRRSRPAQRAAVRFAAGAALAASIAVPLIRRRRKIPAAVTLAALAGGPLALAVLQPRSRGRDIALFTLQMWGFTMAHELPYDDPEALRRRLRIRYPIVSDRVIGLGELPNVRLQRAFSRQGRVTAVDRFLAVVHWAWFMEPHLALLIVQARDPAGFARAARQMAATYDLGCAIYFAVPTAPPWWSAEQGYIKPPIEHVPAEVAAEEAPHVRRIMVDAGEQVWRRAWQPLYDSFNSNPWAAMPSLHFATSLMAAIHLGEGGRLASAAGWGYVGTLGFALIYLGEHYVTDLIVGAALVGLIRRGEPVAEPLVEAVNRLLRRLEAIAA
jgi:hypothetical protein